MRTIEICGCRFRDHITQVTIFKNLNDTEKQAPHSQQNIGR